MEIHDRSETTLGKRAADIIISGKTLVNTYTGELLQGPSVAIKDERAYVGRIIV